jgi:amino acid transporter
MKRIIIAGMLTIVILYVGANLAYLYMMPIGILSQQKEAIARTVMEAIAGPAGGMAIMLAVTVSVFGALNGNCLARPRVAFAMARDGLTFSFLGKVHPRFATPWLAMLIQSAGAIGMVLLRDFDRLTTYFVVVEWAASRRRGSCVRVAARDARCAAPFHTRYPWVPSVSCWAR